MKFANNDKDPPLCAVVPEKGMQLTVLREEQGVLSRLLFTTPVQSSKFMHTVDCLVLPCVYQIKYSSEFVEFIAILIIFHMPK